MLKRDEFKKPRRKRRHVRPKKVYEIWASTDGGQTALVPKDSEQYDLLTRDVEGNQMILQQIFMARDMKYACKVYNEFMDAKFDREIEPSEEDEYGPGDFSNLITKSGQLKTSLLRRK